MSVVERSIVNVFVKSSGMNERVLRVMGKSQVPFLKGKDGAFIVRVPIPRGSVHTMSVVPSPVQAAILALALQIWMWNLALVASREIVSGVQRVNGCVVVVVVVVVMWSAGLVCRLGVESASLVVVVWPAGQLCRGSVVVVVVWTAGLVCRVGKWSASLVVSCIVVVVWSAGLVCRVGVRSASLVVVVWSAGLVCRVGVRSASLVVVVVVAFACCSRRVARLFFPGR